MQKVLDYVLANAEKNNPSSILETIDKFTIEGGDPDNNKIFTQKWTNNMKCCSVAKIKNKKTKGFTRVSWIPDFKKFGLSGYTDDIIKLYIKYTIDSAMLSKVKVYLNDI